MTRAGGPVDSLTHMHKFVPRVEDVFQHDWTHNQRNWLQRLAKQLVHEVIIDREFVNNRFADDGGARQMNKILGKKLNTVLEELNEVMWPEQSA